jgi:hypothetical protein
MSLPRLFDLFWTPTEDEIVSANQGNSACKIKASGCALPNDVYINRTAWEDPTTWVHEFTHILQYSLGAELRGEAGLFYVEPTAIETAAIITNRGTQGYTGSNAFWIPEWGISYAIGDYLMASQNDTHVPTPVWTDLYTADHQVFRITDIIVRIEIKGYAKRQSIRKIPPADFL